MPDLETSLSPPETTTTTTFEQALPTTEVSSVSLRHCGRCSAEGDFLLYLKFGRNLSSNVRLCIERYIRRALRSEHTPADARYSRTPRKRRRYENSYTERRRIERYSSDARGMDRYSDDENSNDDYAAPIKRKRTLEDYGEGGDSIMHSTSTLVMYGEDAGFDLDTTRGNDSDMDHIEYRRGTREILGLPVDPMQNQGNVCFNCSMSGHEIRDCPTHIDKRQVDANRKAFKEKELGQFNSRLYIVVEEQKHTEEMRKRFRPGLPLSSELRKALDLKGEDDTPEYVDSMYYYGYPPAYLGSDPAHDPMSARDYSGPKPLSHQPHSPTPLRVYNDAEDYKSESDDDDQSVDGEAEKTDSINKGESDEEGAIDECDPIEEKNDGGIDRNIPLVMYPGLDLNEFDFTAPDNPGKPLRQRNVHCYASQPERDSRSRYMYYDSPYRHSEHYRNGYGNGDFSGRHTNMYTDYYSQNRDDPGASAYSTQNQRDLEWNTMLTGYYNAAQPGLSAAHSRDAMYSQEYAPPLPTDNPPPPPAASSQLSSSLQDGHDVLVHTDEKHDSEIEDGECNMEESD
ncbi:hypothetical protein EV175_002950 [Coemansia sp. RSA 1933]|nr:hypothetical protein EV175_002950 [Coemansia sp. RSA 1933]